MKRKLVTTLAVIAIAAPFAFADKAPDPQQVMKQMQAQFATMQQLMQRYHQTADPAAQDKLYAEHFQAMQSAMASMHGMGGGFMMGMGPGQGGMGMGMGPGQGGAMGPGMGPGMGGPGARGGVMSPQMMQQNLQYMQDRMDMMQLMMEQFLQHEQAQQPPAK